MPDAPTIYANTLMALSLRRPGILQVTLGTAGFSGEDVEVAVRLAVPEDTAVEIVEALVEGLQAAAEADEDEDDEVPEPYEASVGDVATAGLLATTLATAMGDALDLLAARPDFLERLTEIEERAVLTTRNSVSEGVSVDDEAKAVRDTVAVLQSLFAQWRKDHVPPAPPAPDTPPPPDAPPPDAPPEDEAPKA
ncbi:hypothetical protein NS230_27700 [Methylobacterium indicum]|uniref:DUF1844 domain-containing protein n=1 Tax=Methylobacterium indicum TaxID=1775910 RepID=A0A8H9C7G0_9HYPH|nr:hypothetical protein [Methylobacterium indicum]KMO11029.1 hypothetical protein QR79_30480 [Methylobacterium indicum]KTS29275.1 hypothetical protein NS229_17015 [Methylobacterium indicum]KTS42935.1 hypothetical protein NS230_27700 [Methylobacterium indicum]BCM84903.1 hypothetical protein mvi_33640 [Methylobacterium indicum]